MEHQPKMGLWSLAGLWLDWQTPGGRKGKKLQNCLYVALAVFFELEMGK